MRCKTKVRGSRQQILKKHRHQAQVDDITSFREDEKEGRAGDLSAGGIGTLSSAKGSQASRDRRTNVYLKEDRTRADGDQGPESPTKQNNLHGEQNEGAEHAGHRTRHR